jgi:hypothetical protein
MDFLALRNTNKPLIQKTTLVYLATVQTENPVLTIIRYCEAHKTRHSTDKVFRLPEPPLTLASLRNYALLACEFETVDSSFQTQPL